MKKQLFGFLLLLLVSLGFSQTAANATASIINALSTFCFIFNNVLPMVMLVALLLAGLIFAAGQTMGAETRARANVWATNLLTGAVIAGVVYLVAPAVIGALIPGKSLDLQSCTVTASS